MFRYILGLDIFWAPGLNAGEKLLNFNGGKRIKWQIKE